MQPVLLCTQTACERSKMNQYKKKLSEESHYFCWAIKIETLSKCPFDIPLTAWFFSGPGPVWCFGWNGVWMTPVDLRLWETITDGREETRCSLRSWIDEFPPLHQPMRFGNKAFRSWKGSSGGKDGCKFDGILYIIYIIYYIYIDSHFIHVMQLLNLIFEASETMWAKRSIASASFGCCPQFSVFANELNLPLGLKSGGF